MLTSLFSPSVPKVDIIKRRFNVILWQIFFATFNINVNETNEHVFANTKEKQIVHVGDAYFYGMNLKKLIPWTCA
ncbi:hypothetical protein AN959_05550 [Psychrobacillus sp. FJAT-21963]|nr:hypothetical protein AN959_05550 [Psychrobacillus sp. FJAT-21963]